MPRRVDLTMVPTIDVVIPDYDGSPPIRRATASNAPQHFQEGEFKAQGLPNPEKRRLSWLAARLIVLAAAMEGVNRELLYVFRARNTGGEETLFWLDKGAAYFFMKHGFVEFRKDSEGFVTAIRLQDKFLQTYGVPRTAVSRLPFDPWAIEDRRLSVESSAAVRPRQASFADELWNLYGGCAITGLDLREAVDAAHIVDYFGDDADVPQNGILLRADLHRLYDRGLLDLVFESDSLTIRIADRLRGRGYDDLHGQTLRLPEDRSLWPAEEAITWHREQGSQRG
jgi:hypothetical protein